MGGHGSKSKAGLAILGVAGAVLYLLHSYTARKVRRIEAEVPAIGDFVTVDGLPQHFVSKGAGKPVVLIHGSDGTLRDYTVSMLDRMAQKYHALAFDRPGHGYSARPEKEPLTIDANARIIRESLRELGIERPLIVGHSYGGSVALAYALRYPDDLSGTVLIAPGAYPRNRRPSLIFRLPEVPILGALLAHTLLIPLGGLLIPLFNRRAFAPDPVPLEYEKQVSALSLRPGQFEAFAAENRAFGHDLRTMSRYYGRISIPTIIVTGDSDILADPEHHAYRLHRAILRSQLVILPNTGHEVHHKDPEAVMDAIRLAWEEVTAARPPRKK